MNLFYPSGMTLKKVITSVFSHLDDNDAVHKEIKRHIETYVNYDATITQWQKEIKSIKEILKLSGITLHEINAVSESHLITVIRENNFSSIFVTDKNAVPSAGRYALIKIE